MNFPTTPAYNNSFFHLLFSFEGRCTRFDYWVKGWIPAQILFVLAFWVPQESWAEDMDTLFFIPTIIISLWISLAAGAKRFHDRGMPGGYLLFSLVPLANIIVFIQLGFFDGVSGANIYGQDPKGRPQVNF